MRGSSVRRLRIFTQSTRRRVQDPVAPHAARQRCRHRRCRPAGRLRRRRQRRPATPLRRRPTAAPPAPTRRRDRRTGCHRCAAATDGARRQRRCRHGRCLRGDAARTRTRSSPASTPRACRTRATSSTTTASRTTSPPTCSSPTMSSPGSPATACASSPTRASPATSPTCGPTCPTSPTASRQHRPATTASSTSCRRSYYPWAVHYRKSLFEEKGYTIPTTKDELIALATKMQADGLIPFAYANDGKWPVQGTFDILNLRLNGYQFHVDLLAGKEDWTERQRSRTSSRHGPNCCRSTRRTRTDARGRKPPRRSRTRKPACSSSARSWPATRPIQTYLDDLDFFNYPEFDAAIGATAIDAPDRRVHDGRQARRTPTAPRRCWPASVRPSTSMRTSAVNPSSVPANSKADTSTFNKIQTKSAELVGSAKFVSQFLDRDTSPDFVSNVIGDAFANFHADPTSDRLDPGRHRSPKVDLSRLSRLRPWSTD